MWNYHRRHPMQAPEQQESPKPSPEVAPENPFESKKMALTVSLAPLTICEALRRGSDKLGQLVPINETQQAFMTTQYLPYVQREIFKKFSSDELQGFMSDNAEALNKILGEHGFSIQLNKFKTGSVGVVAIQDIIVKWFLEGTKTTINAAGTSYEGVHLTTHIGFFTPPENSSDAAIVIVELLTKSDDRVYLVTKRDGELFTDMPSDETVAQAVMHYQAALRNDVYIYNYTFDGVKFPMIMYTKQPDISWILGLQAGDFAIVQALQEVIFKMNEKGAQAKAATALEFGALASPFAPKPKETLIIDKPFLVWIERAGVPLPIFADYMLKTYWKNPGELPERA